MITAAREAGHLADANRPGKVSNEETLSSLGINKDLAAYAVRLAGVPDDVWQ